MVLCLWGGLRRKEADTLAWAQIDFAAGQLHIRRTEYFEPKTEESQHVVDLAPAVLDILRGFNVRLDSSSKPDHSGRVQTRNATPGHQRGRVKNRPRFFGFSLSIPLSVGNGR